MYQPTSVWRRIRDPLIAIGVIVVFSGAIELGIRLFFPDNKYLFRPSVLITSYGLVLSVAMLGHVLGTLLRTILGFLISSVIAVGVGILIGKYKILSVALGPIINLLRAIPSSILIPLLLTTPFFGFESQTYYVTIVFGGIWPILIATADAVKSPHPTTVLAIRQLQMSPFRKLWVFTLPHAAPQIYSGMKVSLAICLILAITAEILVGSDIKGLGHYQKLAGEGGDFPLMYSIVVVVATVGFAVNYLFAQLIYVIPWLKHSYHTRPLEELQ